jgi:CTP synthase (UTP-ammonia lyase)
MGILDAEHEESSPEASTLLISKLTCSLVGKNQMIKIKPESRAYQAYGQEKIVEQFHCNYGLNPYYFDKVDNGVLNITGVDLGGEARIVELSNHPFYTATLFLPQISSTPERPHPLIIEYVKAAITFQTSRKPELKI